MLETDFHASRQTKKSSCRNTRRGMAHSEFKSRATAGPVLAQHRVSRASQGRHSVTCRIGQALGTLRQETPLLMTRRPPCCPRQRLFLASSSRPRPRTYSRRSLQPTLSDNANSITRPSRHGTREICVSLRACAVTADVMCSSPAPCRLSTCFSTDASSNPGY